MRASQAHVGVVPAVPLRPYQPNHYAEEDLHWAAPRPIEQENIPIIPVGDAASTRLASSELFPLQPSAVGHPNLSVTGLASAPKPHPYSYLPDSSPTKRAWMAATGHTPHTVRRATKIAVKPKEETQDGGLFAEFLASIGESDTAATVLSSPAAHRPAARSTRSPHVFDAADVAARLGPAVPTVSPLGDILHEIRRKRLIRESEEAAKRANGITQSDGITSPKRVRKRSRTRSGSRSRTRSRTPQRSPSRERPQPMKHHADFGDEIDVELLDAYLHPLGLSLTSLHSLSSSSIEKLASAVATNSIDCVLPKKRVAGEGRPKPTPATVRAVWESVAATRHRVAHLTAHEHAAEAALEEFRADHPSLGDVKLQLHGMPPPASGGLGLPDDPAAARARAAEEARIKREKHKERAHAIRMDKEEAPKQAPPPSQPKNLPLHQVVPIKAVETLLRNLAGSRNPPPTAPVHTSSARARTAGGEPPATPDSGIVASSDARSRARAVRAFDSMVREENRARTLRLHMRRAAGGEEQSAGQDKPKPKQITPTQLAYHLQTGTRPEEPYTLEGLFCRVIIRSEADWSCIDNDLSVSSVSPPVSPSPFTLLSASPFSFVSSSDFLTFALLSRDRQDRWLEALGFERGWINKQVEEGRKFKLAIFKATEIEEKGNHTPASVAESAPSSSLPPAFRATWSMVFDLLLPLLLRVAPSDPLPLQSCHRLLLLKLNSMRDEVIGTAWATVMAEAKERGITHPYEGRPKITVEEAARMINQEQFDIVEARRFLENHLHLTCLFDGEGHTKPESHFNSDSNSSAATRAPCFKEYLLHTRPISRLPGVSFVDIVSPLGHSRSNSRSHSRHREHSESEGDADAGGNIIDVAAAVRAAHHRARSRSRSRSCTSALDTGLKLKPGSKEYIRLHQAKLARQAEAQRKAEEARKALTDSRRADVAKRAAERKAELRRLKKKQRDTENAPPPPPPPIVLSLPLSSPLAAPVSVPAPVSLAPDDYATDEFDVAPPSDGAPVAPPANTLSESTHAAAAAAAESANKQTTTEKKKRGSTKKKANKHGHPDAPHASSVSHSLSRKPPLPSFEFPAPAAAGAPSHAMSPSAQLSDLAAEPAAEPHQHATPTAPTTAIVDLAAEAEIERARRKQILTDQIKQRKAKQKADREQETAREKKRKDNLKLLQQKCNDIVRPHSADPSVTVSDYAGVVPHRRSPVASRTRVGSSSASRRRAAADALLADDESAIDLQVARAIGQSDLEAFEAHKRREIENIQLKLNSLSSIAAKISDASAYNARKAQLEHERNMKEIGAVQRKVAANDGKVSERARIHAMATRKIEPLRPEPRLTQSTGSAPARIPIPTHTSMRIEVTPPTDPAPAIDHADAASTGAPPPFAAPCAPVAVSASPPPVVPSAPSVSLSSSAPDPRLRGVVALAQSLSSRFSHLIERINHKQTEPNDLKRMVIQAANAPGTRIQAKGDENEKKQIDVEPTDKPTSTNEVAADQAGLADPAQPPAHPLALHSPAASSLPNPLPSSTSASSLPFGVSGGVAADSSLSSSNRVSLPPSLRAALHDRVEAEIVPSVHLQEPYQRIATEASIAHPALRDEATNTVLLPASLTHAPVPACFNRPPLPNQNVSPHALLFAEHVPSAGAFIHALPTAIATPTGTATTHVQPEPLVFTFPGHNRPETTKPYYDLATREYAALQERIKNEKERFKFV